MYANSAHGIMYLRGYLLHSRYNPRHEAQSRTMRPDITRRCIGGDALRVWLTDTVGLERYHEGFVKQGFEDLDSMQDVREEDLADIGVTKTGHRRKLLRCIKELVTK